MFPIGTTIVTCTATDDAGNSASAGFSVQVRGAAAQITLLRERTLASFDRPRLGPSLTAPLDTAAAALAIGRVRVACLSLATYGVLVRATPTGAFTRAERTQLLADTARIRAVLGCA